MNTSGSTPVAFVLSGGGAKGSFSAGALEYLVREKKILPDILTGTSAGAICAGVLAQARGADGFYAAVGELREDIIRMSVAGAAFQVQPWLIGLEGTPLGDDIEKLIRGKSRPPIPADPSATADVGVDVLAGASAPEFTLRQGWDDLKSLVTTLATHRKALRSFSADNRSVMVLDPLEDSLRGKSPGVGPTPLDEAATARDGLQLRLTVTALNAGCTRYVTESGSLVESDAVTPSPGAPRPGVIEGVLASSSVPLVFEPRPLGDDVYVDGGVLMNIPLEPAVRLGADVFYVVLADPLACPPPAIDYTTADMFSVLLRAESAVAFYDQQRRDLQFPRPAGSRMTTIDPTVLVVSTFETEVGLLTINMDYGWLRACSETSDLSGVDREKAHLLADRIAIGRLRSWYLEADVDAETPGATGKAGGEQGQDGQVDPGGGDARAVALTSAKKLVADSLRKWRELGLTTPAKADTWATAPELH